ncbi:MAG TPA: histidine kinase [Flavihumibacter sp.]|nr:histidine kinase [Bacteroidota bacterium]HQD10827.1 histidine kinase [Flavihumibacter sp.]
MDGPQTTLFTAILIAVVSLTVFLVYFFVILLRQQRINRRLFEEKLRTEIETLEKERKRMAADLHDDLGPSLLAIKFQTSSLELTDPIDHETLQMAHAQMDHLLEKIREISNDILPSALNRKGLTAAVRDFSQTVSRSAAIAIHLSIDDMPDLPAEKAVHLFRVLQEIVHNTIKHAAAKNLYIEWRQNNTALSIVTRDDGKGFNTEEAAGKMRGLGLNNIVSRTEILGGKLYLDAAPGKGTRYEINIPT